MQIKTLVPGTYWKLLKGVNGYLNYLGETLSTQASAGRIFQVIDNPCCKADKKKFFDSRIKVQLLEDGYQCWLRFSEINSKVIPSNPQKARFFNSKEIQDRIPEIIDWVEKCSDQSNNYLWGGTIGPDFDCSGLVQSAFASQEIWLPRDAFQQETFCQRLPMALNEPKILIPGDLLFFGTKEKCNHVAIYIGKNLYFHSSGISHGRNGIGVDSLSFSEEPSISSYYYSQFRSAGRVTCCYDGSSKD